MNFFNSSFPGPILLFISLVMTSRNCLDMSEPCWYIPKSELISDSIFFRNCSKYSGSSVNFFLSASVKVYCLSPGSSSVDLSVLSMPFAYISQIPVGRHKETYHHQMEG